MNKPYIALIVSVILWATTFGATKLSLIEIPPISLALFRFVIASLILLLFIQVKKENKSLKNAFKKDTPFFIVLGLIGISLMYILENFAIKFTTTSQVAIIMNADPILIALLAYFFIGEKFNARKIFGIIIGFIGVSLVVFNEADFIALFKSQSFLGNILALAASLTWAIYTIMIKKKIEQYGTLTVTTISSIFGAIFLFFAVFLFEGFPNIATFSLNSWILILYLGIIISGLNFYLWNYALKHFDASKVGMYWFLAPIIAVIIGIFFFKESLTLMMILGTILIFIGIYLTEKKAKTKVSRLE